MLELSIMITVGVLVGAIIFAAFQTVQAQVDRMKREMDSVNQAMDAVLRDVEKIRNEVTRKD